MKKKLLVLPLLALTVGMLSGCTKDDIKAIQDHDAEQDARLDALEGEVAGLKNQISALRTELDGKIEAAKTDYQGKIDSANGQISTLQTQLQTLSTNFDSAKADLKADYEAKIKAVDDKLAPLKEEMLAKIAQEKGALSDTISSLQSALNQLSEDYALGVADLQGQINSLSSGYDALLTALDTEFTTINDQFDAVADAIDEVAQALADLETAIQEWDQENETVYGIEYIAAQYAGYYAQQYSNQVYNALTQRCDAIEAQAAADYESITEEYTAAINELADEMSAAQQNILDAIDDLQNQIDDLNDELNEYIQLLQDDYQSQIDALVDRIGALEDVPVYNVTFDLNYDFYDGSVPDSYTVRVLRGDKLNDSKYALPTNFTNRPGNELVQWNYGDTDDEWVLFGYPVTENMTLKAEWTSTSENHSYDWFHPNEFQREKLDAKGHVRYRCSTHGDACYYDIAEKAGLLFVEDSFTISGRGTVVSGKIAQGRFYAGQIVDVQHGNGETRQHTIKQVLISGVDRGFAVAGDTASLIFESADLYRTDVTSGCMITKADEMILSDEFYVNFHLFSSEEVSYYSSSSPTIQARTNPVMNGYRPELYYAKRGRTVSITQIEYPGENEYLQPGESAGAVMKIEAPKNVCYIPVGEDFGFGIDFFGDGNRVECLPIRESSRVIGYVEIIQYNKVLIQSANVTNDTFVTVLHADDDLGYGEYSYYLHDDDQFWDYDGDWNDYYYPTFRGLAGWDRKVDPSGSYEWDVGEYATTDVSFTVYAQWDWEFNMIFDFEGTDNFKDYSHDDEKGECVTGLFVNAGNWSIEVGDQVVLLEGDYHGGYVEGTTTTIDYIYDWEFEDDFVTSYRGSKDPMYDNIVDIYLRNLTDASMSNVCGIKLKKNYSSSDSVLVIGNSGHGGVDPRGVGLDTKRIATGKALPTINDYIAPTRKLLGFDANPSATTPTYAPGAVYNGSDGRLYAIWDQTAEIFSVKTLDSMGISGRGWRAAFEVKGAAVKVGITSSDQKFYVRFSTGATMLAYISMMSVNLNQLRNTSTISPTIQEASVGQTVWVQFRYISGNNLSMNTYRYHVDYIWAQA